MNFATMNCFLLAAAIGTTTANAQYLRESAQRLRHFDGHDPSTFAISGQNPQADKLFYDLANNPDAPLAEEGKTIDEAVAAEEEAFQALLDTLAKVGERSMPPTESPSLSPSVAVTTPTATPNQTDRPTTMAPTSSPTVTATVGPSSGRPVGQFDLPTVRPTLAPMTNAPSTQPTMAKCDIPRETRNERILAVLEGVVTDRSVLFNLDLPQGLATEWILNQDEAVMCPDDPEFLQRWVLAVIYFSTNGDNWIQCSANPAATDDCGNELPVVGATRFLSSGTECDWIGISCIGGIVTEMEFEENNLVGTIPTEIGLLSNLAIWGMERGGLFSTIPTEVGRLTNLIFLDLDFNALTGSLPDELFTLTDLTQLDVNDNQLTGSINNIGVFEAMEFLQVHSNAFTGTIPTEVGRFTSLAAFTLHETLISGTMPAEVCELFTPGTGILTTIIADCGGPTPNIQCSCCTDCRD